MIRLALIDGGEVAASYRTVPQRLPHVTFVAVVDADRDRGERSMATLGASIRATSLDELIEEHGDAFDAALVFSTTPSRAEIAAGAARAGKHVLVASPMAASVEAAAQLSTTCQDAGVHLMVGSLRFMPSQQAIREALDEGKLGEPGLLRFHRWRAAGKRQPSDIVRGTFVEGIDLAHWLFGAMPNRVYAVGREGYAQVHLGFPNGGMALLDEALTLPEGDDYFSLSLIGSTGAAYADDHRDRQLLFSGGIAKAPNPGQGDFHRLGELEEFVNAIEQHRTPNVTGADGVKALKVAEAAADSLQTGRAMKRTEGGVYEPA